MDRLVRAVGRLLSEVHAAFPLGVCPGDWTWTTTTVGGLIGLLPIAGAMLVALIRRWSGNRYDAGFVALFAAIGLTMTAALPWLGFYGVSEVIRGALQGKVGAVGLTRADRVSLGADYCFAPPQVEYLGAARPVRQVLGSLPAGQPAVFAGGVVLLAVLPLLAMMFVAAQSRLAVRRGPAWPARLLWLPMVPLVLGTGPLSATVVAHLWLGFLPVAVLGLLGVALVGAPRWSVIERRDGGQPALPARPAPAALPPAQAREVTPPAPGGPPRPPEPPAAGGQVGQVLGTRPPRLMPTEPLRLPDLQLQQSRQYQPAWVPAADRGTLPGSPRHAIELASAPTGQLEPPTLPASRFQRIRPLGSGGFGTVWLAVDTALDRTVAVKAAKVPDAEAERRIRREARALAAVDHPNCVRIYDILTEADGELALIMEYVPGRSLVAAVGAEGPLADAAAARLWSTLASALRAAHSQGVLHRDVKPSNIIIDEGGYPHLIDFGIARASGDVTLTATGMVLGTPDYMPPEVAAGQPAGPVSDAWQLAAAVSYALAGQPPRGHRDGAVAAMLAAARGEPCNQLPVHSAHRVLLERALHPDPLQRPSLLAVQAGLGQWLVGTGAQPDGPVTERLQRPSSLPWSPLPAPTWPTEERQ